MQNQEAAMDIILSGVEEVLNKSELELKLQQNRPLIIKAGFDPTAPDLHLGHTVLLYKLKQFQDLGHQVVFLVGDFTAMIGDPTGKNVTRPPLNKEAIIKNAETYQQQVSRVLDMQKTQVVFNSSWMSQMSAEDMIKLAGTYTVARMLERDDFHQRFSAQQSIALHEFLYPLMQGYDSVQLKADIELGGTDQKFNLLMGRELQKHYGQSPQVVITMPLIEGLDGVKKMSKSLNNYIGITETPELMLGQVMSISDELMWKYMRVLQLFSKQQIADHQKAVEEGRNPRDVKIEVAKAIVTRFHDASAAQRAEQAFIERFQKGAIPEDLELKHVESGMTMNQLLKHLGMTKSTSEANRMIQQGAVKVNGVRLEDPQVILETNEEYIVQIGKRKIEKIKISKSV